MRMILMLSALLILSACAELKQTGKDIGHATRDVTKEIGHTTRDVTKDIGHASRDAVNSVKQDIQKD
ncbi:hypothetical protein KDN34_04385 [Shewanella yunxiaonensis]|uniref:Lipoprotein n=1 Tax=Shewanella yunxiaonensis TaxID=2829809 RepID=A0ABX7YWP0_9GAMM|nr:MULTISPECIES: hypothetical protein [Shewanella]MDF0532810.1 hypothetical protein [Shewanella sp. A32]QUN06694.1 hypothetical protein KDN34_04385 [Shewanella yunxiaonensis]